MGCKTECVKNISVRVSIYTLNQKKSTEEAKVEKANIFAPGRQIFSSVCKSALFTPACKILHTGCKHYFFPRVAAPMHDIPCKHSNHRSSRTTSPALLSVLVEFYSLAHGHRAYDTSYTTLIIHLLSLVLAINQQHDVGGRGRCWKHHANSWKGQRWWCTSRQQWHWVITKEGEYCYTYQLHDLYNSFCNVLN